MITSVLLRGIGGQGILTAAKIVANAAANAGFDVCSNEIHGMAQRGGSVTAQIRFGEKVWSPLIIEGSEDVVIDMTDVKGDRTRNIALVGEAARKLPAIPLDAWLTAIKECVKPAFLEKNIEAFNSGYGA